MTTPAPLPSVREFTESLSHALDEAERAAVRHLAASPSPSSTASLIRTLKLTVQARSLCQRLARNPNLVGLGHPRRRRWIHRNYAHAHTQTGTGAA